MVHNFRRMHLLSSSAKCFSTLVSSLNIVKITTKFFDTFLPRSSLLPVIGHVDDPEVDETGELPELEALQPVVAQLQDLDQSEVRTVVT